MFKTCSNWPNFKILIHEFFITDLDDIDDEEEPKEAEEHDEL